MLTKRASQWVIHVTHMWVIDSTSIVLIARAYFKATLGNLS